MNGSSGFTPISAAMRAIRAWRDLGLRHPDHIFVGHAHGEVTRRLAYETPAGPYACVDGADRCQPVEIESRIGEVLISGKSPHAGEHDVAGGLRHHDRALELGER